ncbi:MAG: hypothetical protein AAFY81_05470, partial [Pseudomonadota bacterium]
RVIGLIFLAITFGGFVQSYFIPLANGEFVAVNEWMHPHAVVSFAFAALFVAQPWDWPRFVRGFGCGRVRDGLRRIARRRRAFRIRHHPLRL